MKITQVDNLKGKDRFKFLTENKSELIAEKKQCIKFCDPFQYKSERVKENDDTNKADGIAADATSVRVKVIANSALYFDSQYDVLLPDCWKRSIKERKGMIPHLHDHVQQIEAKIGEVVSIYSQEFLIADLGVKKAGTTQVLIFETDVLKSYNEKVFNQYKSGRINQHSIGLQYVKLELAINDEESEKEFDFWNKYINQIINKEDAEEAGFFWVVPEIKLLENSCVLFGSNILTPTLDVKADTGNQPPSGTDETPSEELATFDLSEAIRNTKFF